MATLSGAWAAHRKKYSNYNKGLASNGYTQWQQTERNTYSSGSEANTRSFYVVRAQLYGKLLDQGGN